MAYRRSICTRATILARRFNPSFTYTPQILDDSKESNKQPKTRKIDKFLTQTRPFGAYNTNFSGFGYRKTAFLGGIGNGVVGYRFMSTSTGKSVDKAELLSDVVGVVNDASVEVISSQAPVLSEVAIAAVDSAYPVAALQYVIDAVHSFTGLNWAVSIALTTVLIRGATIPFLIKQLKTSSKLAMMKPRLDEIKEEMDAKANDPAAAGEGREKMNAIFKEYGVTPFTPLKGIFIQAPIFISFFLAISNMAEKVPSLKNGGAFWFTDLTTPDPMYIFPVLAGLTFLITVECNMQEGLEGNPHASTMKKFSRGLAVLTVPFTMNFPKAVFCYWITSNIFSFAYGSVLKISGVKEALGVPKVTVATSTNKKPGTQSGFSLFKALKEAASKGSYPATTSGQSKPAVDVKKALPPSSSSSASAEAILKRQIKNLEKNVKKQKKNKRQRR